MAVVLADEEVLATGDPRLLPNVSDIRDRCYRLRDLEWVISRPGA